MTSLQTIQKEVEKLRQVLTPKPEKRIVVRMWVPDDDPRHDMTDEEIENYDPHNKFIIKPLRKEDL